MKANEMTTMQKAIFNEIKKHNAERDMAEYNKGIKFYSMKLYEKNGLEPFTICHDGTGLTRYEVACEYKAEDAVKGIIDLVVYQVNIYSNGEVGVYFDGTYWDRK